MVARQAHNLEAEGSIPSPATKNPRTYISVSPFILPRFREVTQTENSISTVKSVVVKILENTHFPHFAYIFCKQNVSKIYCLKDKSQIRYEPDELPMLYPAVYIRVIMEGMIFSELADVDSRLRLERGDGNQHPPLNPCPGIGHSVVIPAPVRTHLLIAVRSSLCLHLSSCPIIISWRGNYSI